MLQVSRQHEKKIYIVWEHCEGAEIIASSAWLIIWNQSPINKKEKRNVNG